MTYFFIYDKSITYVSLDDFGFTDANKIYLLRYQELNNV